MLAQLEPRWGKGGSSARKAQRGAVLVVDIPGREHLRPNSGQQLAAPAAGLDREDVYREDVFRKVEVLR